MGQCVACRSRVSPIATNAILNNELKDIREKILEKIYSVHNVYVGCSNGIENCKVDNNKSLAVLLRSKYVYLKSQEKVFQDLMKRVDEAMELEKSSKKREIIEESKKTLEATNEILARNDVSKILENQSDYLKDVEAEVKSLSLNFSEIEAFVEKELPPRTSGENQVVRIRYNNRKVTS